MVMMAPPVVDAAESVNCAVNDSLLLLLTPQGAVFDQKMAADLSKLEQLTFICGHYEGIDERIVKILRPFEVSLGDFVTMGGEFPAFAMIEAIVRLIPGVIGDQESLINESFCHGLLDYPHYTRPPEYRGEPVPDILISGHHKRIEQWRRKQALTRTRRLRPDLFEKFALSDSDRELLEDQSDA